MHTLDKHIVKAMLSDGDIISLDLNEPLDGDQILGEGVFPYGHMGDLDSEYTEIALLPRKTAVFLFEFQGHKFRNVALPQLPADHSTFDVHRLLKDKKVT